MREPTHATLFMKEITPTPPRLSSSIYNQYQSDSCASSVFSPTSQITHCSYSSHRTPICARFPDFARTKKEAAHRPPSIIVMYLPLLALLPVVLAAPAPAPAPIAVPVAVPGPHYPLITPPPSLTDRNLRNFQERGIVSSVVSDATSDIAGLGSYLSSAIGTFPSYIASGVPNFFQDFPTGSAVESSLGISDSDLAATPTQVLNVP